jgi:hypothetical protein
VGRPAIPVVQPQPTFATGTPVSDLGRGRQARGHSSVDSSQERGSHGGVPEDKDTDDDSSDISQRRSRVRHRTGLSRESCQGPSSCSRSVSFPKILQKHISKLSVTKRKEFEDKRKEFEEMFAEVSDSSESDEPTEELSKEESEYMR